MASERMQIARTAGLRVEQPGEETGEDTDEALAVRGDADSFVLLYRRHLDAVYAYLYARLGNREESEDVTSVAFERALHALDGYRPVGQFKAWLFTIVHRALVDHYRRRRLRYVPVESVADSLTDPAMGPEDIVVRSEEMRQVRKVMRELSAEQQEIVAMRFMAGLRYAEIAQVVGKREAAVKMAAYRAIEEIRRRCGDVHE